MVLGEKLWEEKGKVIGMSVKSIGSEGVRMEETFTTEVKGLGRFPSGRNMGTMDIVQHLDGISQRNRSGDIHNAGRGFCGVEVLTLGKTEAGKSKGVVSYSS